MKILYYTSSFCIVVSLIKFHQDSHKVLWGASKERENEIASHGKDEKDDNFRIRFM